MEELLAHQKILSWRLWLAKMPPYSDIKGSIPATAIAFSREPAFLKC